MLLTEEFAIDLRFLVLGLGSLVLARWSYLESIYERISKTKDRKPKANDLRSKRAVEINSGDIRVDRAAVNDGIKCHSVNALVILKTKNSGTHFY